MIVLRPAGLLHPFGRLGGDLQRLHRTVLFSDFACRVLVGFVFSEPLQICFFIFVSSDSFV